MKKLIFCVFALVPQLLLAQTVSEIKTPGAFAVIQAGKAAPVLLDNADDELIAIAGKLFVEDVQRVSGQLPALVNAMPAGKSLIIVGTVGKSKFIQDLIASKKLQAGQLKGAWERYQIQLVKAPYKGVDQALVIAGSDKRGAAYGLLELSRQMGVSPWYWWADVPVLKRSSIYVSVGAPVTDASRVKYRGIFINDEAPAFSKWTKEKFGGVNHSVYEKIFELILRLKGNYLWPAMWGNAFNDDDKLNPVLADKWGIVMGTSHHEPMQRAQQEWKRYGKGAWDYTKNDTTLRSFWRQGIVNMGKHESLVTIGMRGDGDEPMTQGTATALLEGIVKDQRKIIEEVTGKPASQTPQIWALYKEVQDYYDKGMRVPDDVTLLLSDDNWGDLRKLPALSEKPRAGGYGIYYHFDYVGDPRNYKWINTNNIARVWEQMHQAWDFKARQVWIVNVGDIKPMEFPISFFLDYAWNPTKWNEDNLNNYYTQWGKDNFGAKYGKEIGDIIRLYSQYAARRKPELLDENTYSLQNYQESGRVVGEWNKLLSRAESVNSKLDSSYRDAFFQVVLHPLKATANLHEMYEDVAYNKMFAAKNDARANAYADKAKATYRKDSLLSVQYNSVMAGGKWNHMMDQVHIGYRSWNDPPVNRMPKLTYVSADAAQQASMPEQTSSKSAVAMIGQKAANHTFFEKDGYVALEAEHFTRAINANGVRWKVIPDIGKTASGVSTFPVTAPEVTLGKNSPHLEFDFYTYDKADFSAQAYFSPTLNFRNDKNGFQYAVSVDDEQPQMVSVNSDTNVNVWRGWVGNNVIIKKSNHKILTPGKHILKYWMVSNSLVLQKMVLDFGGVKPSYLGPPETLAK
jgi:hypothetical protein